MTESERLERLVDLDRVELVAERLTVHDPHDRMRVVGVHVDHHLGRVGRPSRARPGSLLAAGAPRIISVQIVRGTEKIRGAALTYQSAASLARLAIASSVVSAQCTNVNTPFCGLTNFPAGCVHRVRPVVVHVEHRLDHPDRCSTASSQARRRRARRRPRTMPGDDTVCHSGGCGSCTGFGTTWRGGIFMCSLSHENVVLRPRRDEDPVRLVELLQRRQRIDAERVPLGAAGPGERDLGAAVAQVVEHRRPLGDAQRVVDDERRQDAGVPEVDPLGALREGRR